jgi:cation transport regulator
MSPKKSQKDMPENLKNVLPEHAQHIYKAAHHQALEQYKDPAKRRGNDDLETVANKVAWAAVKEEYKKEKSSGKWVKK